MNKNDMEVCIHNKKYKVNENEYTKINHPEYNYLKLYNDIGLHERIIGFIKKCKEVSDLEQDFFSFDTKYGGFIPLNVSNHFKSVYLLNTTEQNHKNIRDNKGDLSNLYFSYSSNSCKKIIIYSENYNVRIYEIIQKTNWIIITKCQHLPSIRGSLFLLSGTEYYIHVDEKLAEKFTDVFRYYIEGENGIKNLTFDNLINVCIMVKNGGPQFEQMLIDNLPLMDKWTILDTGSTDDTIDIIKRVLGKKDGQLYQEPFINFRDSRNRLLDLAGSDCKYTLMLDDTYVIKGKLREFLTVVRSDQYCNSFSLFIHTNDTKYGTNRIVRTDSGLRYIHKIHEVISDKNNINVFIPENVTYLFDGRFDYMEKRTIERKQLDLKLLYEEIDENPQDPRAYYYLGQTYSGLGDYENAYKFFLKRAEFTLSGFIQERVDALFEAARIANFQLNKPWNECIELYEKCFKVDESRPESLYFIGIHYYLEGNHKKAFPYLKQGFEIGYPNHCQYALKPTISFHFLPKFLTRMCYNLDEYQLGEQASNFFIMNNNPGAEDYNEMVSLYNNFVKLNKYKGVKQPRVSQKPLFVFVADGGFNEWDGSTILEKGVGGSETYIIEMAKWIQKSGRFQTIVFCKTPNNEISIFEDTIYKPLDSYYEFVNNNYIQNCIISRFSEYLPVSFKGFTENVYLVVHDLTPSGIVIPMDKKLKNIFCLTEWHVDYFNSIFPSLSKMTVPFYYGIDGRFKNKNDPIHNKFIYSSFPNRGLLQLLQMWPNISKQFPTSTLHIYSDVNNKWSNEVEPLKMQAIRELLSTLSESKYGIHYHGWVSKQELAEAWKTADIWFYPCTFMETFCLTALEAASSRTFVVTNDLAALQNTVGDRGAIIRGDPTTKEWQNEALTTLFYFMKPANGELKNALIDKNFTWASSLSWESQSQKMLETYILPNSKFEYKGMYNWTNDVPEGTKQIFEEMIAYFNKNQICPNPRILEIGTYAGISLINIVNKIPSSTGIGVDLWSNYDETNLLENVSNLKVKDSFYKNIATAGLQNRIRGVQLDSTKALLSFITYRETFNFIYIDGSHLLLDCYSDLLLAWEILVSGGILVIGDYLYKQSSILESPFEAVNHFLKRYEGTYKLLDKGYRVFLEKL